MPFEIIETVTKDNQPPMASVSYMRHVRKGKEMDRSKIKPKLIVTLPTVICISKCKKFRILIGTGADRGKIRIEGLKQGVPGGIKATDFKGYIMLRFGHVPSFGDEIFEGVKCPIVRVDEDTYDLKIPEGLVLAIPTTATPLKKLA